MNDHLASIGLKKRQINDGLGSVNQAPILGVASYPDDIEPHSGIVEPLADAFLTRPVTVTEILIDDSYQLRFLAVMVGKFAPGDERSPHRPKVVWTHNGAADFHRFMRLGHITFGVNGVAVNGKAERRKIRQGHGLDAGKRPELGQELPVEGQPLGLRITPGPAEIVGRQ